MGAAASARPGTTRVPTGSEPRTTYDAFIRCIRRGDLAAVARICKRYPAYLGPPSRWSNEKAPAWHVAASLQNADPLEMLFSMAAYHRTDSPAGPPSNGPRAAGPFLWGASATAKVPCNASLTTLRDMRGLTALMVAASEGSTQCIRVLLEQGADPWLIDPNGFTALHWAASAGHSLAVEMLLDAAASCIPRPSRPYGDVPCKLGLSALHCAAARCQAAVVEVLLRQGASVSPRGNVKEASKLTPFGFPAAAGTYATPLHVATVHGSLPVIKLLLSYFLENVLVRSKSPMSDPRAQRNGAGLRAVDLLPPDSEITAHDPQLRMLLDPAGCLPQLLPDVAKAAISIRNHRRIDGNVATLQMLAAAVLSEGLAASAVTAAATAAAAALIPATTATATIIAAAPAAVAAVAAVATDTSGPADTAAAGATGATTAAAVVTSMCRDRACVASAPAGSAGSNAPGSDAAGADVSGIAIAPPLGTLKKLPPLALYAAGPHSKLPPLPPLPPPQAAAAVSTQPPPRPPTPPAPNQRSAARLERSDSTCSTVSNRSLTSCASTSVISCNVADELCGICMIDACVMRNSRCNHGLCASCALKLCRLVPGKLMPLQCPFCRGVVASFVPVVGAS